MQRLRCLASMALAGDVLPLRSPERRQSPRGLALPDVPQAWLQPGGCPALCADDRRTCIEFIWGA